MKLISLELTNFKGIKHFMFLPAGKSVSVYGENGTGKTTLLDGWLWLVSGKDSLDQAPGNFELKTILPDGDTVHSIEHIVSAVIDLDGERVELKKVYAEKYTKKRGTAQAEMTGHATDHYIDGVPKSHREYQDYISGIADNGKFRMLSNIRHFNESLSWQDRRRVLLDVCGDIADSDVIASDPELSGLPIILGKKTVENWRKVAATDKTRVNKELTEIPARIDEATRSKVDVGEATKVDTEDEIKALQTARKGIQDERQRTENGGEIAEKTKKLAGIEGQLQVLRNNEAQIVELAAAKRRKEIADLEAVIYRQATSKLAKKAVLESRPKAIEQYEAEMSRLREQWASVNAETFKPASNDTTCSACGQSLPADQIVAAREKAIGNFNETKAKRLAEIREKGHTLKAEVERLKAESVELEKAITEAAKLEAEAQAKIDALKATPPEVNESPEALNARQRLQAGKEILEGSIAELRMGSHDALAELDAKINDLDAQIQAKQELIATIKGNYQADARIRELTKQQKDLAAEFEKIEAGLFLTDLFVRTKVSMLTERINSRFPMVQWKLFDVQINGAVSEMCEATINGVPYRNLNEAARIASGCEIQEVLSENYGVWLPRWIDGCESIINVPPSAGQIIRLVVSKDHQQLTVVEE